MKGQIAFASRVSWTKLPNRWREKRVLKCKYKGLVRKECSLFFSEAIITIIPTTKCAYIIGTSFRKFILFFHKVPFIISTLSLCVRRCRLVAYNSWQKSCSSLRTLCCSSSLSPKRRPQSVS
jgi:hypothetical protein